MVQLAREFSNGHVCTPEPPPAGCRCTGPRLRPGAGGGRRRPRVRLRRRPPAPDRVCAPARAGRAPRWPGQRQHPGQEPASSHHPAEPAAVDTADEVQSDQVLRPYGGACQWSTVLTCSFATSLLKSLPVVKVEEALVGSPAGWLSAMAGEAQARGDEGRSARSARPRTWAAAAGQDPSGRAVHPPRTSLLLTWEPVGLDVRSPTGRQPRVPPARRRSDPAGRQRPLPPAARWSAGPWTGCCSTAAEATLKDFLDRLGEAITDGHGQRCHPGCRARRRRRGGCALTRQPPPLRARPADPATIGS